jgi:hypothetical protein
MEGGPLTQYIQRAMQAPKQQDPNQATADKQQGPQGQVAGSGGAGAEREGAGGGGHVPTRSGPSVSFAPDTQPEPAPAVSGYSDLEAICW